MDSTPPQPPQSGPEFEPIRPIEPPVIDYMRLSALTGKSFSLLKELSMGHPQVPDAVKNFDEVSRFTTSLYDNGQQAEKVINLLLKSGNPDEDSFAAVKENFSDMARTMVEDNVTILFNGYASSATIVINGGSDHVLQLSLKWFSGRWNIDTSCIRFALNDKEKGKIICEIDVWDVETRFHIYFKQPENAEELALWEGLTLAYLEGQDEFRFLERKVHENIVVNMETFKVLETADLLTDFEAAYDYYDSYGRRIHQVSIIEQEDNLYAQGTTMKFGIVDGQNVFGEFEPMFFQEITGYQGYIDPDDTEISILPDRMAEKKVFYKAKVIKSTRADQQGVVLESRVEGAANSPIKSLAASFHEGSIYELEIDGVNFYRNQDQQDFIVYRSPKPGEFIILADKIYGVDKPISYRFKFAVNTNGQIETIENVPPAFEFLGENDIIPFQMSLN